MGRVTAACVAAAVAAGAVACEDRGYRNIGAEVRILTERRDALVPPALARLARHGRRALPQIEVGLHTAPAAGKRNLVRALEAIGDPEAAPVLRHCAVYDPAPEAREACEELLRRWAAGSDPLAAAARLALARVADKRARGEAPVVIGEGDRPGL